MSRILVNKSHRRGAVAALFALLLIPMLGLVALAVDYGYLLTLRNDLQRTADHAALAAVQDLVPDDDGEQNLAAVRATLRHYVEQNAGAEFKVQDSDIEIGRYDPDTIYSSVTLLNDGIADTVRVTLRRDDVANASVSLFFARLLGIDEADLRVTATAVLQKGRFLEPGVGVLPIAISENSWDSLSQDELWRIYSDGKIRNDNNQPIPGNWGTVDIGNGNNSTKDLRDQIENGLRQRDLDAMADDNVIPSNDHIDSDRPMWVEGDTGLSSGMKHAVENVIGTTKLVPIYNQTNNGNGNNSGFRVTGWAVVKVMDSHFAGSKNTYIEVQKSYTYDRNLTPSNDLSNTSSTIEGAYTTPALIQ
ncbi:MAG: pilus assembly protein TadG-related protein [Pirellulaceae bacterium]